MKSFFMRISYVCICIIIRFMHLPSDCFYLDYINNNRKNKTALMHINMYICIQILSLETLRISFYVCCSWIVAFSLFVCVRLFVHIHFDQNRNKTSHFFYDAETITMFLIKNIAVIIVVCGFVCVSEFFILYPLKCCHKTQQICGKL